MGASISSPSLCDRHGLVVELVKAHPVDVDTITRAQHFLSRPYLAASAWPTLERLQEWIFIVFEPAIKALAGNMTDCRMLVYDPKTKEDVACPVTSSFPKTFVTFVRDAGQSRPDMLVILEWTESVWATFRVSCSRSGFDYLRQIVVVESCM
jgi:hypothetical protein